MGLFDLDQSQCGATCLKVNESISMVNPGLNCVKVRRCDAKVFACGGWDSRVRVFGLRKKKKLLAVLDFHKEPVYSVDFDARGMMAAGSSDGCISFWNLFPNS